jgi:uncharacterized membrane protein
MKFILALLPTVLLLSYGQLVSKWRVTGLMGKLQEKATLVDRLFLYMTDPYIVSAYVSTFVSSIVWFYVLEKYPVSTAFPASVGAVFVVVIVVGVTVLRESFSLQHVVGVSLILIGVVVASRA